jgi:hypothetical protein
VLFGEVVEFSDQFGAEVCCFAHGMNRTGAAGSGVIAGLFPLPVP